MLDKLYKLYVTQILQVQISVDNHSLLVMEVNLILGYGNSYIKYSEQNIYQ